MSNQVKAFGTEAKDKPLKQMTIEKKRSNCNRY